MTVDTYGNMKISYDGILQVFDVEMELDANTSKMPGRDVDKIESKLWSMLNTKCKRFMSLTFVHAFAANEVRVKGLMFNLVNQKVPGFEFEKPFTEIAYYNKTSQIFHDEIPIIEIPPHHQILFDFIKIMYI